MLVEKLKGRVDTLVNAGNLAGDRLLGRAELYILHAAREFRDLNLSIQSHAGAAFRVTIGFFRRTISDAKAELPCNLCKVACKLILTSILAHLGVPYLGAEGADAAVNIADYQDKIGTLLGDPTQAGHDAFD